MVWWILDPVERRATLEREGGWRRFLRRELRNRLLRRSRHGRPRLFVGDLGAPSDLPLPAGVRIEVFDGRDWETLRQMAGPRTRALFRRRAAAGRSALVAWRGERPIGICWLADRVEPALEGQRLDLEPGSGYGYGLFVVPRERGKGIATALTEATMRLAAARGFRRYCILVYEGNRAALGAARRAFGELAEVAPDEDRT